MSSIKITGVQNKYLRRLFQSLTCEIVTASSKLIVNNLNRPTADDLWTENEEGSAPLVICSVNSKNEITCILDLIQEKKDELKLRYSDIAILYRNRATGRLFESELHKRFYHALHWPYPSRKIRFGLNGKPSFYHRKEVRDILAYLQVLSDENDDSAFRRIINVPDRGLEKTLETVEKTAKQFECSLLEASKLVAQNAWFIIKL